MNPDPQVLYKSSAGYDALQAWYANALARLPVPVESRRVETRFGGTHLLAAGPVKAPALFLLHPLSANALAWSAQIPALSHRFRLYLPDLVGHAGRSAPTRLPYDGPAHAHWLEDVLDALDLKRVLLAGLALGGWLGLKYAAHDPPRVERLALLSPAGLLSLRWRYLLPLLPSLLWMNERRARRLAHRMLSPPGLPIDEHLVEFLALVLLHFKSRNEAPALSDHELQSVTAPVLLLVGQHEDVWPPQDLIARARSGLTNLQAAEIVPDAGHALNANQPTVVSERLERFFLAGE